MARGPRRVRFGKTSRIEEQRDREPLGRGVAGWWPCSPFYFSSLGSALSAARVKFRRGRVCNIRRRGTHKRRAEKTLNMVYGSPRQRGRRQRQRRWWRPTLGYIHTYMAVSCWLYMYMRLFYGKRLLAGIHRAVHLSWRSVAADPMCPIYMGGCSRMDDGRWRQLQGYLSYSFS